MPNSTDMRAAFANAKFIKATPHPPAYSLDDPMPFFRREFTVSTPITHAELLVQAPGFGKFYINGHDVTEDIFISATSDYDKILWYNTYDVTALLREGKNTLSAIAGNGFLNESFQTAWDFDTAPPLLAALTTENRDLVAHALEGIELLDTEEELWKREVYRNTSADAILGLVDEKPYEGVDAMTDQELSEVADYVFGSITILDSVALRPSVAAYLHECFDLSDRREILFRHAIFERWGGFDTRFPHFLYRAVIDGYFAPILPEFAKRRRVLTL